MPVTIDYRVKTDQYEHYTAWLPGGEREIPGIKWADVLRILHAHHGLPVKFHIQDFLARMVFAVAGTAAGTADSASEGNSDGDGKGRGEGEDEGAELIAVFCAQGRRRGEVLLSIPSTVPDAVAIMQRLGDAIEARQAEIRQEALDSGIPADFLDAEPEDEDW